MTSSLVGSSRRSGAFRPPRTGEETARRGGGQSADRPHPPAKPARRRSLRYPPQAGQSPGGVQPPCRAQRLVRRLGCALGGRLSPALEHRRLERPTTVEGLHPAHPGRSGFSHSKRSAEPASGLASARGPRPGSYSRLLPRLRALEDPRDVATACGPRKLAAPILEELARIQSHDVVLPTAPQGQIRLRCVAQPDAAQAALLDRLGIVLPKRMRPPENELPTLALSA